MSHIAALLVFALCSLSSTVLAQRKVQCEASREACESPMLDACPSGAVIVEERIEATARTGTSVRRYQLAFRCADEAVLIDQDHGRKAQLSALRAERARHRLGGPLSALFVGVGATGLMAWAHTYTGRDVVPVQVFGDVLAVGLVVAGATWLAKVVRTRRSYDREIQRLSLGPSAHVDAFETRVGVTARLAF